MAYSAYIIHGNVCGLLNVCVCVGVGVGVGVCIECVRFKSIFSISLLGHYINPRHYYFILIIYNYNVPSYTTCIAKCKRQSVF